MSKRAYYDYDNQISYVFQDKKVITVTKWHSPHTGQWIATRIYTSSRSCVVFLTTKGQWKVRDNLEPEDVRQHIEDHLAYVESDNSVEIFTKTEEMLCILAGRKVKYIK